jgi:hypothetical protein
MKLTKSVLSAIALTLTTLVACSEEPPAQSANVPPSHLVFGNSDLQSNIRYGQPIASHQDSYGLMHVQLNIQSTYGYDQNVDAFITFTRDGQLVEKIGPETKIFRAGAPDIVTFTSTQPADNYIIFLDYAK